MNLSGVKVGATRRRGTTIAAAALTMAMVAPIIHPIVNPNQAAVAQAQTAASNTMVEAGTTVYSNTQQYRGYACIDRAGAIPNGQGPGDANVNADDQPLVGLNIYPQWRDQSGFVSAVLHAVTDANGQYYFDLSQTFYDARGGAHKFRLSSLNDTPYNGAYTQVRTWSDNPDVNRYTPVIVGDMYANGTFHGRTDRKQESWNFTSGVDVIENGKMAFQEKPNWNGWTAKPKDQWTTATDANGNPTPDGQFIRTGTYATVGIGSKVWWEQGENTGTLANYYMYEPQNGDQPATGVNMVASYVNDEVARRFDAWKAANPGVGSRSPIFQQAQEQIIKQYEAETGIPGSAIAETVAAPVKADGTYYLPFKGTYGANRNTMGRGITPDMFGQVAPDYKNNSNLEIWNNIGLLENERRQINQDYMYIYPDVNPGYGAVMGPFESSMFNEPYTMGEVAYGDTASTLPSSGYTIRNLDYQLVAPNPQHEITVYKEEWERNITNRS